MNGVIRGSQLEEFRNDGHRRIWLLAQLSENWLSDLLRRNPEEQMNYLVGLIDEGQIDYEIGRTIRGIHLERFELNGGFAHGGDYAVLEGRILETYSYDCLIDRVHFNDMSFQELSAPNNRWLGTMLFKVVGFYSKMDLSWGADGPWALFPIDERMQSWFFGFNVGLPYECIVEFLDTEHLDWLDMLKGEDESQQDWNLTNAELGKIDYGNFYIRKSAAKSSEIRSLFFTTGQSTWYRKDLGWEKSPVNSQLNTDTDLKVDDAQNAIRLFDRALLNVDGFTEFLAE